MRHLVIEIGENTMFIISLINGWGTGGFHLFVFDVFHEQPKGKDNGVYGVSFGLLGFKLQVGCKYEKQK